MLRRYKEKHASKDAPLQELADGRVERVVQAVERVGCEVGTGSRETVWAKFPVKEWDVSWLGE